MLCPIIYQAKVIYQSLLKVFYKFLVNFRHEPGMRCSFFVCVVI